MGRTSVRNRALARLRLRREPCTRPAVVLSHCDPTGSNWVFFNVGANPLANRLSRCASGSDSRDVVGHHHKGMQDVEVMNILPVQEGRNNEIGDLRPGQVERAGDGLVQQGDPWPPRPLRGLLTL